MSAEELAALARSAAAAQRLGMAGRGGEVLARLVDGLARHLEGAPERARGLAPLLAEIVAAQGRGDQIGLADRLEHELAPRLEAPDRTPDAAVNEPTRSATDALPTEPSGP